jgi:hypothetical protein
MADPLRQGLPWWRQAKVTGWDRGIGLALIVLALALKTAFLGNGWGDSWIAAGCWFLVVAVFVEVRRRLSRADREAES